MDTLELLAHPVRLRIVHALRGGRALTTAQLCGRIADVHRATVYRHIELLHAGGVLAVAEQRRVRGAVERSWRLCAERATMDADAVASLTPDDHRRGFAAAMAALLAEFDAYLARDGAEPLADLVGYRQHAVWLSRDELVDLIGELQRVIVPRLAVPAAPHRDQYLLSPVLFPIGEAPAAGRPAGTGDATGD